MSASDWISTILTVAEAKGRENLAGALDPAGTIARAIFYSYSTDSMLHSYGWRGWLCMTPVLVCDLVNTKLATRYSRKLKAHPEANA